MVEKLKDGDIADFNSACEVDVGAVRDRRVVRGDTVLEEKLKCLEYGALAVEWNVFWEEDKPGRIPWASLQVIIEGKSKLTVVKVVKFKIVQEPLEDV